MTTTAQKRDQAKAEYNAFLAACPSRHLLDRISNKWVVPATVSYELTALGSSLHHLTRGLRNWAQTNMTEVLSHRGSYDAGTV